MTSIAAVKADIRSRPARWGMVLVVLLLMVDVLSIATWMTFPSFKVERTSASTAASDKGISPNILKLANKLRDSGADPILVKGSRVHRPKLSVPGTLMTMQGDNIQVFEYAAAAIASREAEEFLASYGGSSRRIVPWTPAAHLYVEGPLLVLYSGNRAALVSTLNKALGIPLGKG